MSEEELKNLFEKIIPSAYRSLNEAKMLPDGEIKHYKVEKAYDRISQAFEVVDKCESVLNIKYSICFYKLAEGQSYEDVQSYLVEMGQGKDSLRSIFNRGIKAMSRFLTEQKELELNTAISLEERIKARRQRMEG